MSKLHTVLVLAMFAYLALGSASDAEALQAGTAPIEGTQHLREFLGEPEAEADPNLFDAQLSADVFGRRRRRRRCGWACKKAKKAAKFAKKAAKSVKKHVKKGAKWVKKTAKKGANWVKNKLDARRLKKVNKYQKETATLLKMRKGKIVEARDEQIKRIRSGIEFNEPSKGKPEWWIYHKSGAMLSRRIFIGKVTCPCQVKGRPVTPVQAKKRIIAQIGTVMPNGAMITHKKREALYRMKLAYAAITMIDCWKNKCSSSSTGAAAEEAEEDDDEFTDLEIESKWGGGSKC